MPSSEPPRSYPQTVVDANPVSRTVHEQLVNDVRALKARLCLGLPIIGLAVAQLVATVGESQDRSLTLSASLAGAEHPNVTIAVLITAAVLMAGLALAALQLSPVTRIAAIVLACVHGILTIVLWFALGGADSYQVHAVLGYGALPSAALWALIGAVTSGRFAD